MQNITSSLIQNSFDKLVEAFNEIDSAIVNNENGVDNKFLEEVANLLISQYPKVHRFVFFKGLLT